MAEGATTPEHLVLSDQFVEIGRAHPICEWRGG
jgi:hypothetical protein